MKKPKIEIDVQDIVKRARNVDKPVISIRFEKDLYKDFKSRCKALKTKHTVVLEELMRDFLSKTEK
jgi:FixJ family two-component response regulator